MEQKLKVKKNCQFVSLFLIGLHLYMLMHLKRVPLFNLNFHRWIGTGRDWVNESTYDEDTERLIGKAVEKGYSLRHDAFGMHPYYGNWEREFAQKWFYKRPIIMEGGWVVGTHRYWTDSEGK